MQRHTREHIYSQRQRHIAKRLRFYKKVWSDEFHSHEFLLSPYGRLSKTRPMVNWEPNWDGWNKRIYNRAKEKQRFRREY